MKLYFAIALTLTLLVLPSVYAAPLFNNTGIFILGNKSLTMTYDVVICRSTNVWDDIVKQVQCTHVCSYNQNNCSGVINSAIPTGNLSVLLRRGNYSMDNSSAGRVNLCGKSNTKITGEGIGVTILTGNGFSTQDCAINTTGLEFRHLEIDVNGSHNNALKLTYNTYQIGRACEDCVLDHVYLHDSNPFLLHGQFCGGEIRNSIFKDSGTSTAADLATVTNFCPGKQTKVINNLFIRQYGHGGGHLTNGGTYDLLIEGNKFYNPGNDSYAAISMEGQVFNATNVIIANNVIDFPDGKGAVTVGDTGYNRTVSGVIVVNNIIRGGGIYVGGTVLTQKSSILGNEISGTREIPGIYLSNCDRGCKVNDNTIIDWNILNYSGAGASSRPAIRIESNYSEINDNLLITTLNQSLGTFYGIRFISAYNNTAKGNRIIGVTNTADHITYSTSSDNYVDSDLYTTLPSCNDLTARGTILSFNNSGIIEQRVCFGNIWNVVGNGTNGWSNEGTFISTTLSARVRNVAPAYYYNETDQTAPAGQYRTDVNGDLFRFVRSSTVLASFNTTGWFFSNGNVLIGTGSTAARKLHVNNTLRLEPVSAAPSSAALGDLYVDSDTNEFCFYNSSAWVGLQGRTCA